MKTAVSATAPGAPRVWVALPTYNERGTVLIAQAQ